MEFTPSSRGRAKPITQAALKKMQAAFVQSEKLLQENMEREAQEKQKNKEEMDALFDIL